MLLNTDILHYFSMMSNLKEKGIQSIERLIRRTVRFPQDIVGLLFFECLLLLILCLTSGLPAYLIYWARMEFAIYMAKIQFHQVTWTCVAVLR